MTVLDILGVWNLFITRRFVPVYTTVYTIPRLKLPALVWVITAIKHNTEIKQSNTTKGS